ncbi:MAG: hypothetical protein A2Y02_02010 [Omnitrophica bacterium GWA2_52_12]|nr:MAG: hypothetical protein A2Y02_02010 [Omnitrophica bacterium GWA2_52_12]
MKNLKFGIVFAVSFLGLVLSLPAARAADLPEGDYQYSCMGCMLNLNMLNCQCRDDKGMVRPSSLMTTGCSHDISNKDGKLVCGN